MNDSTIRSEIGAFVRTNYLLDEKAKLQDDQSLIETGVIDSTGVLELVTFIEEKYGVKFRDDELTAENFASITSMAGCILAKLGAGPA